MRTAGRGRGLARVLPRQSDPVRSAFGKTRRGGRARGLQQHRRAVGDRPPVQPDRWSPSTTARRVRSRPRRRRHCGDHVLHQHLQPVRSWSGAALLAKKAVEAGLSSASRGSRPRWRRAARSSSTTTSAAGLTPYLDKLGFNLVGFGCTTCIGNSGPLFPEIIGSRQWTRTISRSFRCCPGNRNFEGRINPDVKMNYLASPPLVVAYALAGTMDLRHGPPSRWAAGSDGNPGLPGVTCGRRKS